MLSHCLLYLWPNKKDEAANHLIRERVRSSAASGGIDSVKLVMQLEN